MNLYLETVNPTLVEGLDKLFAEKCFDNFRLVGGTALSLQYGHRYSVDIDLFTDIPYGEMPTQEIKESLEKIFPYTYGLKDLDERALGYSLFCGNSKDDYFKLDLFYTEEFQFSPIIYKNWRITDARDIAAMKISAIDNSLRMKDFWDLHELLNHFSFKQIIQFAIDKYPYSLSLENVYHKISNLDKLTLTETEIISLKGNYWELVMEDLIDCVNAHLSSKA